MRHALSFGTAAAAAVLLACGSAPEINDCGPGLTFCSGGCANLDNDPNNCGACGVTCGAFEVCGAKSCLVRCGPGLTSCSGGCANLHNDPNNCGACGAACAADSLCSAGACVPWYQVPQVASPLVLANSFTGGVPATDSQCQDYVTFRVGGLVGSFSSISIYGSLDPVGVSCNDPALATQIAALIHSGTNTPGTTALPVLCNGQNWNICNWGGNPPNLEIWVGSPASNPTVCNGGNCPSSGAFILRPCIGNTNPNWGGINGPTCGGATQDIVLQADR